jgi:hypothetical protein
MRHKSKMPESSSNATPASPSPSERIVRDIRRIDGKRFALAEKMRNVSNAGHIARI